MELTVRGESVHVNTVGKQMNPSLETVLFIHGVGQDHTIWVLPLRYFANHDRNVLGVDLPGHGRSAGSPLTSIHDMADWVVEVLDVVGVEKTALVGHSMGSLVALDATARHGDRVRSLVMVGVSIPLAVADPLLESAANQHHDAIDMLTYWSHSNASQIGGNTTPGIWMTGSSMRLWERADPAVIHSDLLACSMYEAGLDRGISIDCPTLLLLAEEDRMTPVRGAASIREVIADQETVVFQNAGHPLLQERPDPVLDELIRVV